jgi:soluble lytic murein transglycosylase-like protein
VDWRLASFPLPPDLEPITTSAILEIASLPRALKHRSTYLQGIAEVAATNGVAAGLVDTLVRIESRYDPTAVGSIGEIGLMQVRPKTAAMLGFDRSSAELSEPKTNMSYGVTYLTKVWRLADGTCVAQ